MIYLDKVNELLDVSKKVINDCVLPNGGIVAANTDKPHYPEEANNYNYIWPRDAGFICMAGSILGLDVQESFFKWCTKAEGWTINGLFYEKYHGNGKKAAWHFQPDQTGIVLLAIYDYLKRMNFDESKLLSCELLLKKSADGLCKIWDKNGFSIISQDLWEERLCFPDLLENFTYSLAACSKGLKCAYELFPNEKWLDVSIQIKDTILNGNKKYFIRSFGKLKDERIDASLIGLAWPFEIVPPHHALMIETIKRIERSIVKQHGVHRYEHDDYDGWMYKKSTHRRKGSGYWPILNFWLSIYYCELGEEETATVYYNKVINDLSSSFIPEQIFNNNIQVSVSPLAWSHAMFVIATQKLGLISSDVR